MNKYFYTAITVSAIALSSSSLNAKESYSQNISETVFVCATESEVPTMFAYTPGKITITPLISWHQEYLLPEQSGIEVCQQVASKLQELSQQQQERYITTESKEDHTLVCMVTQENDNCSSETSELLFRVNPNYDASCILDRREPLECLAVGKVRGIFSYEDKPYKPLWWIW
ncbi:MAG: COP23 domain-containing protein [Xenococcaceae cyanobacterium MO_234.B1]|nr:COP23 domain-containing protein [Xenococcaceae cyanobacterium MO_234.B1]